MGVGRRLSATSPSEKMRYTSSKILDPNYKGNLSPQPGLLTKTRWRLQVTTPELRFVVIYGDKKDSFHSLF